MTELLTAAQMRAIEQAAIASGEVTGLELMERAGRGVVEATLARRPDFATAPGAAFVLCGPGNNGGDGFVVARLLRQRGWHVDGFLYGCPPDRLDRLPAEARANAERWVGDGGTLLACTAGNLRDRMTRGSLERVLLVEALFGTGLSRACDEPLAMLSEALDLTGTVSARGERLAVAVDMPAGYCSDSGRRLGRRGFEGELLVTFQHRKIGQFLLPCASACRRIAVVDIGISKWSRRAIGGGTPTLVGPADVAACADKRQGHKYDHGHALVLAGGVGRGGAARLAARGALRIGAGAVTVGAPPAAIIENAAQLDAIMLRPVRDVAGFLSEAEAQKINAICLGPGMGRGEATRAAVAAACGSGRRVVLDADALTSFEDEPEALFALLHEGCVLTPHPGEFGRLFPDLGRRLAEPAERGPAWSRLDAAREAAARSGCAVLLKGADTVIADASGRAAVSAAVYGRAAPWLATAGAGDVLAGMIAGLLARGWDGFAAARHAAWLHVEAARRFGPGLVAEDLPEQLPGVFRDLGL